MNRWRDLLRGKPCLILGGGSSLRYQIDLIRRAQRLGMPTIGVNQTTYRLGGCHFGTLLDWGWVRNKTDYLWRHPGLLFMPAERLPAQPRYNLIGLTTSSSSEIRLSDEIGDGLYINRCGGGFAISVAWFLGASKICLVGFDCQADSQGREHWYDDQARPQGMMSLYHDTFEALAPLTKRRVINCSAETALTGFPRGNLETEIGRLDQS